MKKICSLSCIILGATLILIALSLVFYNVNQDKKSGESAGQVLQVLKQQIEIAQITATTESTESTILEGGDLFAEYEDEIPIEEKSVDVDNNLYIGIISIPSLDVELPVMSEWSYDNLKLSPCRYKGSIAEENLIVASHNYNSHFGKIQNLNSGDIITFTDVVGNSYHYEVIHTEIVDGQDISGMEYGSENWDLTLFTCTLSGQSRVTVRAVKIK